MKVLHTADWHWGADEAKLAKAQASAEFIIAQAEALKPDVHVIAGDWWDRRQVLTGQSAVNPAIEAMWRLAEISPVVLILGNYEHDPQGSHEIFKSMRTTHPIYCTERAGSVILTKKKTFHAVGNFLQGDEAALIHLFPYPTKAHFLAGRENLSIDEANEEVKSALTGIFHGMGVLSAMSTVPVVFVGHCNMEGAVFSTGQTIMGQDIHISAHDLALAGAAYYALGHIHKAQEVGPNMKYSGSIFHCNFGETEEKSFTLVEINDAGTFATPFKIPSRPLALHEVEFDLAQGLHHAEPTAELDWHDADSRVRIHVTKENAEHVTEELVSAMFPGAYSIKMEKIVVPENRLRAGNIQKARTLRDKVQEWGKSVEKEISADVIEFADETEKVVAGQ